MRVSGAFPYIPHDAVSLPSSVPEPEPSMEPEVFWLELLVSSGSDAI